MKLTPEFFEKSPNWIRKYDKYLPELIIFESNTKRIRRSCSKWDVYVTVTFGIDNLTGGQATNFHIDNCDRCSIASFDVETLEQANQILGVYNIRLGDPCASLYIDPTWIGDEVIAEYALPIITSLARKTIAYPTTLNDDEDIAWKEWRKILGSIIFSLHQVQHDHTFDAYDFFNKKYPDKFQFQQVWDCYYNRVQKGLENFGKYFCYLSW